MQASKAWLRRRLPPRATTYAWRLRCWGEVLREVRGDGAGEELKLILSALAAPVMALRGLDEWRTPALLFDTSVRIAGPARFRCRRGSDDLWHLLPSVEPAVRAALGEQLEPGGVFVDAGANMGVLTVLGAQIVGPQGRVVAIEMMPGTAEALRANLAANNFDWVRVVELALSDAAGREVEAVMPVGFTGHASIVERARSAGRVLEARVVTTTLDDVTRDLPRLDVLKVDLEGAEALAFAGGKEALSRARCVIFEDRGKRRDAAQCLSAAGFTVRRLDAHNMIGVR